MKFGLLFFSLLLSSYFSFSQSSGFGIRVGGAYNTYKGGDWVEYRDFIGEENVSYKFGPAVGFYVNTVITDFLWVKTDLMYINRGFIKTVDEIQLQQNEHYIDIYPVSPAIHFKGFQVFAGPSVGIFVFNSYQNYDSVGERIRRDRERDDDRSLFEFGVVGGVEYQTPFGLNLGIRYVHPFSSMYRPVNNLQRQWYNRTFLLTVGFTFAQE